MNRAVPFVVAAAMGLAGGEVVNFAALETPRQRIKHRARGKRIGGRFYSPFEQGMTWGDKEPGRKSQSERAKAQIAKVQRQRERKAEALWGDE